MKKRIISVVVLLSLISSFIIIMPITASATAMGKCGDNLTWSYNDGKLTISGTGAMTNWQTEDEMPWYDYIYEITDIVIKEGVTTVGDYSFMLCTELQDIILPDSLTTIGNSSFYGCYTLKMLRLGKNVKTVGTYAFADCYELESLIIFDKISKIGECAFDMCVSLRQIFYSSSKDAWNKVTIDYGNDSLGYYDIKFNYNGDFDISANIDYCYYAENKFRASVSFNYISNDCVLVLAVYDNDGRLMLVHTQQITKNTSEIEIKRDVSENLAGLNAKVFFIESINSLRPVGELLSTTVEHKLMLDIVLKAGANSSYKYPGECESMDITFSTNTIFKDYYLIVYRDLFTQIGTYYTTELQGETINVPGNEVILFLNKRFPDSSNLSDIGYFETTKIVINF